MMSVTHKVATRSPGILLEREFSVGVFHILGNGTPLAYSSRNLRITTLRILNLGSIRRPSRTQYRADLWHGVILESGIASTARHMDTLLVDNEKCECPASVVGHSLHEARGLLQVHALAIALSCSNQLLTSPSGSASSSRAAVMLPNP